MQYDRLKPNYTQCDGAVTLNAAYSSTAISRLVMGHRDTGASSGGTTVANKSRGVTRDATQLKSVDTRIYQQVSKRRKYIYRELISVV